MKQGRILFVCFLMCVMASLIMYWQIEKQNKKTGVVDAVKLFDSFNMKKELESHAKTKLIAISKQADSIGNQLKMARATNNEEEIKKMTYAYNYINASLEDEYKQSNQDINEQVWKRLNPLIMEFGKKKALHLIIGANGMGSVLYNDEYYDLTGEIITYVNNRYEKGN